MRSYRAEYLSQLVGELLQLDERRAQTAYRKLADRYPIALTRSLDTAKEWLREKARGNERYGIVASSSGYRLKPLALDVRLKPNVVHWFLADRHDVRSSYYLEDAATEFQVQGLELEWACIAWDADFRASNGSWDHRKFRGTKWVAIRHVERQMYQRNAYRVLLTRARQGMVICIPKGCGRDPTRKHQLYDTTYEYLRSVGFEVID